VLHNVKEVKEALPSLTQLSHLEHLDISQLDELYGDFAHPSHYLEELVKHLPKLRSLDISGTNLASTFREEDGKGRSDGQPCDIPGLAKRIDTPLDFLGLFWTQDEACRREHIPAIRVAGNHNQEQLLLAGTRYLDRPMVMEHVIDNLVQHVRMDPDFDQRAALSLAVNVLARYPRERKLLRHASALIYYLLESSKLGSNKGFTGVIRQRLLSTLLGVMRQYQEDGVLMRNGCMVLWRFDTFESGRHEELLAQYPQVVDILLFVVEHFSSGEGESYIQETAIYLLNALVCQVDGDQKKVRGVEIVETMLRVVKDKLESSLCDEVMKTAWSVMWNVTDETPANSERFLDKNGMEVFLQCKEAFPDTIELLRNMMGLLGNIADVSH
jgi:Zyg-11 family protein